MVKADDLTALRATPFHSAALRAANDSLKKTWRKLHDPLDNPHRRCSAWLGHNVVISNLVLPELNEMVCVITRVNPTRLLVRNNTVSGHVRNLTEKNVG